MDTSRDDDYILQRAWRYLWEWNKPLPKENEEPLDEWELMELEEEDREDKRVPATTPEDFKTSLSKEMEKIATDHRICLRRKNIGYVECEHMLEMLERISSHFQDLQDLDLHDNVIDDEAAIIVVKIIEKAVNLTRVHLSKNSLSTKGAEAISEAVAKSNVKALNLSQNEITDASKIIRLAVNGTSDCTATRLEKLNISKNKLDIEASPKLKNALLVEQGKKSNLKRINLGHLHLGDKGGDHLLRAMQENTNITHVCLAGNLLTDSVCYIISDLLGTNTELQYLDLSENYFGELAFYDQQFQKKADKISADFNDDPSPEGPNILSADVHAKLSDEFESNTHKRAISQHLVKWTDFCTGCGANRGLKYLNLSDCGLSCLDFETLFIYLAKHKQRTIKQLLLEENIEHGKPLGVRFVELLNKCIDRALGGELPLRILKLAGMKRLQSERQTDLALFKRDQSINDEDVGANSGKEKKFEIEDVDPHSRTVHPTLSPEGIVALCGVLETASCCLTEIDLSFHYFDINCLKALASLFANSIRLKKLGVNFCQVQREDKIVSPEMFATCQVDLLYNLLTNSEIEKINYRGCGLKPECVDKSFKKLLETRGDFSKKTLDFSFSRSFGAHNFVPPEHQSNHDDQQRPPKQKRTEMDPRRTVFCNALLDDKSHGITVELAGCDLIFAEDVRTQCYNDINSLADAHEVPAKRRLLKKMRAYMPINHVGDTKHIIHFNDMEAILDHVTSAAELNVHFRPQREVTRREGDTYKVPLIKRMCEEGRLKNLFEAKSGGGNTDLTLRRAYERNIFGVSYDYYEDVARPKYGTINLLTCVHGDQAAKAYGKSYLTLRDEKRRHTTITSADSVFPLVETGTLRKAALVLLDILNRNKRVVVVGKDGTPETVTVQTEGKDSYETYKFRNERPNEQVLRTKQLVQHLYHVAAHRQPDSMPPRNLGLMPGYIEAQIHGEISLDQHIEKLCIHPSESTKEVQRNAHILTKKYPNIQNALMYMSDSTCIKL
eukprot:m.47626 g.47626  ORF g.47626 m.47626 type:complete len:1009 (+) comp10519_c0_seq2:110-3136(+)